MESKITHYVVKPEHLEHYKALCTASLTAFIPTADGVEEFKSGSAIHVLLSEAKVLYLWCDAVQEKPRVKGWYNVHTHNSLYVHALTGKYDSAELAKEDADDDCLGQIFIDQEIE